MLIPWHFQRRSRTAREPGSSKPRLHGRHAFTLVEMMVVVVLIGILTAMIIPEMKGSFEEALLRSTSRELLNAFSLASSRAVSFNQPHRVRLDRQRGRYFVEKRVRTDARHPEFAPVPDTAGAQGQLDPRISVQVRPLPGAAEEGPEPGGSPPPVASEPGASNTQAGEAIAFYPDGTADAVELLLRDRAGFQLALRINPITARVRIVALDRATASR